MDLVLLLLRIVVGGLLVGHGTQKLFGWFGGHGLEGTAGFFGSIGYRPPVVAAFAAGASEAIGGALLVLGMATPLAAAMVVGTMVNAIFSVHWNKGIWSSEGGYEFPLVLAVAALAIVATGPGVLSVDAVFGAQTWGGIWAFVAAVTGLVSGAVVLKTRRIEGAAEAEKADTATGTRDAGRRAA